MVLAAVAKPGDTIILGFVHSLCDDDIVRLKAAFEPLTEAGIKVAFADQMSSMTIARTSQAEDAELEKEFPPDDIRNDPTWKPCGCGCDTPDGA